jgi:energy-coupling factor transporter ATP-binding protein EcfA2
MMKMGRLPFHGAMFQLTIRDKGAFTFLVMGDTGAGKSETLEALRQLGADQVEDLVIIADDMGSLKMNEAMEVIGYGTETGAFVRLDDLQPGYAFGQIDRAIIMNPNQTNARVVIPITTFDNVIKGFKVDFVLYANNYETVDETFQVFEQFSSPAEALSVFRKGEVMSKGTTTTTGLVHTYFANIFGPQQYQALHEELAKKYFQVFFDKDLFVGQMRTQLGIVGMERSGPEQAARELLKMIQAVPKR